MAVQVDVGRTEDGEAVTVVFHGFPVEESLLMRILISDCSGDVDVVATRLRRIAERLEQGALGAGAARERA